MFDSLQLTLASSTPLRLVLPLTESDNYLLILPSSHTHATFHLLYSPRARYQAAREISYAPEPAEIIQTSQA